MFKGGAFSIRSARHAIPAVGAIHASGSGTKRSTAIEPVVRLFLASPLQELH